MMKWCFSLGEIKLAFNCSLFLQVLETFIAGEAVSTGPMDDQWLDFPADFPADFPEALEELRTRDDDGAIMQEILESVQAQPEEDSWRETVIDNDLMFGDDLLNAEGLGYLEGHGFDSNSNEFAAPSGALATDDYLEINDLTFELDGSSEIQLRPPRSFNVMAMQQLVAQGDSARRMYLRRPQPFISQAESFFNVEPAVSQQQPRILHSSASSRDLSAFAERASSSLDLERHSGGWSIDGELSDLGREGAGVVPDQGIESS